MAMVVLLLANGFEIRAAEIVHIVVRGDTIFSLSRSHGISQEELLKRNGMTDHTQLQIGMKLYIPQPEAATPPPGATSTATATSSTHTVLPGETLFSIARARGVTLQALRDANGFSQSRVLLAGETIRIPPPQTATSRPVVAPPIVVPPLPSAAATSVQTTPRRRANASLRWPLQSSEVYYMEGNLGGILIFGKESESVRSISSGTVVHAGPWRGYGNVVIVESTGGYRFIYGGNDSLSVRRGDSVEIGAEVGKLGKNITSGKPELVLIVLRNGMPVDPATAPRS
jgi:murein DD-endopeptidase MepM/ murein hydrolase activator NlpD